MRVICGERPSIVLPVAWRSWTTWKLQAVLAHELTHVRRGDWYVGVLAVLNKAIFWFHPLAWWLERRLAVLAERASDEGAISVARDRAAYASVLLEVSATVVAKGSRLALQSVPMAGTHPVTRRVQSMLEHTRPSSGVLSTCGWSAVAFCTVPVLCLVAAAQAPSTAPSPPQVPERWAHEAHAMKPNDAATLEQQITQNPQDLVARGKLLSYYLYNADPVNLNRHAMWVIQNHPGAEIASHPAVNSPGFLSDDDSKAQKKALWQQQASIHFNDPRVLGNAGIFLYQSDPPEAERFLKRAYELEPANRKRLIDLSRFYVSLLTADAYSIMGNTMPLWHHFNAAYPAQLKAELSRSNDIVLLADVGSSLAGSLRSVRYSFGPDKAHLTAQVQQTIADTARTLLKRAQALDPNNATATNGLQLLETNLAAANNPAPSTPKPVTPPASTETQRIRVGADVIKSKIIEAPLPEYPGVAMQARIRGTVRLNVVIATDGSVSHIQLQSGHPLLVPAATEAVRGWKYQPTYLNGNPVEVEAQVDVPFKVPE